MTDRETPKTPREQTLEAQVEVLQLKLRGYEMQAKYNPVQPPEFKPKEMTNES